MAQLGWLGIVIPEAYGGAGLGYGDLMVVMEELGRGLVPEPMLVDRAARCAGTLVLGGTEAQKQAHLPGGRGRRAAAGAGARRSPAAATTSLTWRRAPSARAAAGRLTGEKIQVLDGARGRRPHRVRPDCGAERDREGVTLFLVPRDARRAHRRAAAAHRRPGRGARAPRRGARSAPTRVRRRASGRGAALLERVVDRATIALTAEMLGGMTVAFEMTLDYLKTRAAVRGADRHRSRRSSTAPRGSSSRPSWRARSSWPRTRALDDGADDRPGRPAGERREGAAAPTPSCWSPTRPCRCTAASA